jgi:dipeptidyl aminopeptidase/acylaminoacyl peptidase
MRNGELISRTPVTLNPIQQQVVRNLYNQQVIEDTTVERIAYYSDNLKITGYLTQPKADGQYPLLVWNRGGSNDYGALDDLTAHLILASTAVWGYVVLATQYRGNMGSEGEEDWGGNDVRDSLNLLELTKDLPNVDMNRIAVEGASRGGMTTYRMLTMESRFKCAMVHAGVADLFSFKTMRNDLSAYIHNKFGGLSEAKREIEFQKRSAVYFADKLSKNVPLLLMHGTDDTVVPKEQSISLDKRLTEVGVPHELVLIEGGKHVALKDGSYKQIDVLRKAWLEKYCI